MTTPGSIADWIQASVMAAALAGLAATSRSALREADADAPPHGDWDRYGHRAALLRPPRPPRTRKRVRSVPAPTVSATSRGNSGSAGRPSIDGR
jgi:hypothetical protein